MQLFAKTSDPFLLKKSIHRDGTTFDHLCNDGTVEVAYFSGSRTIHFKGQHMNSLKSLSTKLSKSTKSK